MSTEADALSAYAWFLRRPSGRRGTSRVTTPGRPVDL